MILGHTHTYLTILLEYYITDCSIRVFSVYRALVASAHLATSISNYFATTEPSGKKLEAQLKLSQQ